MGVSMGIPPVIILILVGFSMKPSSYGGIPMAMETPKWWIGMGHFESSALDSDLGW